MEDSVKMVSDKYDETRKNFDTQNSSIKKLQSENKQLKDSVKGLELRLSTAEDYAAKQEQWAKQHNLEIIGIPEVSGESLQTWSSKWQIMPPCLCSQGTSNSFIGLVPNVLSAESLVSSSFGSGSASSRIPSYQL